MKGNPTAGILLLVGATLLIVLGVTDKGKKILQVLMGTDSGSETGMGNGGSTDGGTFSGSASDPNSVVPNAVKYPGAYVGEKAAIAVPIQYGK